MTDIIPDLSGLDPLVARKVILETVKALIEIANNFEAENDALKKRLDAALLALRAQVHNHYQCRHGNTDDGITRLHHDYESETLIAFEVLQAEGYLRFVNSGDDEEPDWYEFTDDEETERLKWGALWDSLTEAAWGRRSEQR